MKALPAPAAIVLLVLLVASVTAMGAPLPARAFGDDNPSGDIGGVPVSAVGSPVESSGVPAASGGQAVQQYLTSLYRWFLGFVGVAALFAFVMGGIHYMFAGPSISTTAQAKKWITNALLGILLAASSWLLLKTINPELVAGFDIQTLIKNNLKDLPKQR